MSGRHAIHYTNLSGECEGVEEKFHVSKHVQSANLEKNQIECTQLHG